MSSVSENNKLEVQAAQPGQYLTFSMRRQVYAIPISSVVEINQMSEITPIPETPSYVNGVLNLRGKIIPIIDLRLKFSLEFQDYTKESCIIVVETQEGLVGMIVDAVREVKDFKANEIEHSPKLGKEPGRDYVSGIGKSDKDVVILLDLEKVFLDDSVGEFSKSA